MKTLLIVFHTMTGGSRQMAEAAQRGAAEHEVHVRLLQAREAQAEDVLAADIVRRELRVRDDPIVICGMAMGYADPEDIVNTFQPPRIDVDDYAVFLD